MTPAPVAVDLPRLRETLGHAGLAWLLGRVRQRLERGGDAASGAVTLRAPTREQRAAVDRLLGRRPGRAGSLTVSLAELDRVVRHAELAEGLAAAVVALTGPVADERARAAAEAAAWRKLRERARARVDPESLGDWLDDLDATGLLRRLAGGDIDVARRLLDQVLAVVDRLPAAGVPLAELAAVATGDSHGLDAGSPAGTLAVRAAATLGGVADHAGAAGRRDAWASVGVLCDELSAPALVLGLRGDERTVTGRALALHADAGEPYRLSVRQLLRDRPRLDRHDVVRVCENPTVLAAAANRLGAAGAPLVCLEGQPRTAARLLLDRLAASGTRLAYHGDFDWPGLRIANLVVARHGALPWRMGAGDYGDAAAAGGAPLTGAPAEATWDPDLAPAMRAAGVAVHEERLLDVLLTDLAV